MSQPVNSSTRYPITDANGTISLSRSKNSKKTLLLFLVLVQNIFVTPMKIQNTDENSSRLCLESTRSLSSDGWRPQSPSSWPLPLSSAPFPFPFSHCRIPNRAFVKSSPSGTPASYSQAGAHECDGALLKRWRRSASTDRRPVSCMRIVITFTYGVLKSRDSTIRRHTLQHTHSRRSRRISVRRGSTPEQPPPSLPSSERLVRRSALSGCFRSMTKLLCR